MSKGNVHDSCNIRTFIDRARGKEEPSEDVAAAVHRERHYAMTAVMASDSQVERIKNLGLSYGVELKDDEAEWLAEMWDEKKTFAANPEIAWT